MNNKLRLLIQKLIQDYPKTPFCQHLGLALGDYQSIEFVSNKILVEALELYTSQLELEDSFDMSDEDLIENADF